jgi:hypothetical protein
MGRIVMSRIVMSRNPLVCMNRQHRERRRQQTNDRATSAQLAQSGPRERHHDR